MFDLGTTKLVGQHHGIGPSLSTSRDGESLVSEGQRYEMATGLQIGEKVQWRGQPESLICGAFGRTVSLNGRLGAAMDEDGTILVFDTERGETRARLDGHSSWFGTAVFSNDATLVATTKKSGLVRVWRVGDSVADSKLVARMPFSSNPGSCHTLAISPDNSMLAAAIGSSGVPGVVTIWDISEERVVGRLQGHSDAVLAIAFSPDGTQIATGARDRSVKPPVGDVRIWPVPGRGS